MKKLILLIAITAVATAHAQDAVTLSRTWTPYTLSTYNQPINGYASGAAVECRIGTTVRELGIRQIAIRASYADLSRLTVGHTPGLFGSDVSVTIGTASPVELSDRSTLYFEPAIGVRYSSKTFYNTANGNPIIGSHLNAVLGVGFSYALRVSDDISLTAGYRFDHASNMNIQRPNNGMNQTTLSFGISHTLNALPQRHPSEDFARHGFSLTAVYGSQGQTRFGYFVNPKTGKGMYPDTAIQRKTPGNQVEVVSVDYSFSDAKTVCLVAGTDLIYRERTLNYDHFFQTYQGVYSSMRHFNAGVRAGIGFQIGRVGLQASEGYLIAPSGVPGSWRTYTALEGSLAVTRSVRLVIKSHPSDFGSAGLEIGL